MKQPWQPSEGPGLPPLSLVLTPLPSIPSACSCWRRPMVGAATGQSQQPRCYGEQLGKGSLQPTTQLAIPLLGRKESVLELGHQDLYASACTLVNIPSSTPACSSNVCWMHIPTPTSLLPHKSFVAMRLVCSKVEVTYVPPCSADRQLHRRTPPPPGFWFDMCYTEEFFTFQDPRHIPEAERVLAAAAKAPVAVAPVAEPEPGTAVAEDLHLGCGTPLVLVGSKRPGPGSTGGSTDGCVDAGRKHKKRKAKHSGSSATVQAAALQAQAAGSGVTAVVAPEAGPEVAAEDAVEAAAAVAATETATAAAVVAAVVAAAAAEQPNPYDNGPRYKRFAVKREPPDCLPPPQELSGPGTPLWSEPTPPRPHTSDASSLGGSSLEERVTPSLLHSQPPLEPQLQPLSQQQVPQQLQVPPQELQPQVSAQKQRQRKRKHRHSQRRRARSDALASNPPAAPGLEMHVSPNLTQPTGEAASPSLPINMVLTDSNKSLEFTGEVLAGLLVTPVKLEAPALLNPGSDAVPGSCQEAAPACAASQAEAEHHALFSRPGIVLEGSELTANCIGVEVDSGAPGSDQGAKEDHASHTEDPPEEADERVQGAAEQRNQRVGAVVRGSLPARCVTCSCQ